MRYSCDAFVPCLRSIHLTQEKFFNLVIMCPRLQKNYCSFVISFSCHSLNDFLYKVCKMNNTPFLIHHEKNSDHYNICLYIINSDHWDILMAQPRNMKWKLHLCVSNMPVHAKTYKYDAWFLCRSIDYAV